MAARVVVLVDIGSTFTKVAVVALSGEVVSRVVVPTRHDDVLLRRRVHEWLPRSPGSWMPRRPTDSRRSHLTLCCSRVGRMVVTAQRSARMLCAFRRYCPRPYPWSLRATRRCLERW